MKDDQEQYLQSGMKMRKPFFLGIDQQKKCIFPLAGYFMEGFMLYVKVPVSLKNNYIYKSKSVPVLGYFYFTCAAGHKSLESDHFTAWP